MFNSPPETKPNRQRDDNVANDLGSGVSKHHVALLTIAHKVLFVAEVRDRNPQKRQVIIEKPLHIYKHHSFRPPNHERDILDPQSNK